MTAGESLEAIQRSGIGGASVSGYDEARRRESEALVALRNRLPSVDPAMSGTTIERAVTTLRAGAATPDGRRQLLEGRLTTDIEPGGFEPFAAAVAKTAIEPAPQPDVTVTAAERRRRQRLERDAAKAKIEAEEAATEAARLALDASEAERRARDLRNLADAAADRARHTRRRADELAAQLEQATG